MSAGQLPHASPEDLPTIESIGHVITSMYRPLPYHNRQHAFDVLDESLRLATLRETHGEDVNRPISIAGSLLHDAFYDMPLSPASRFGSKEERSGMVAKTVLPILGGFSSDDIEQVVQSIACTQAGVKCENNDDKALVRADIKNLRDSPVRFLSNSLKLFYESKQLHAEAGTKPMPWVNFVLKQQEFLDMYLGQDLSFGSYDRDENGVCLFTKIAQKNVARLSTETVMDFGLFYRKFGEQLIKLVPRLGKEEDLDKFAT
jgi:hypothetical protein